MKQLLTIVALWFWVLSSSLHAQILVKDQPVRTWTNQQGKQIQATLERLDRGFVTLRRSDGKAGRLPLSQLSTTDQRVVMDITGWGRIWTTREGDRFIADFRRLEGESAFFETLQGEEESRFLRDLSGLDQSYIRARSGDHTAPDLPVLHGKVVGVTDGDTLRLLVNKRTIKVRLEGIDCPEKNQAFGNRAKQFLSEASFGKEADVRNHGTDKYGRTLGRVFVGGKDINAALVEAGLAWHYKTYSDEQLLADLENQAREQQVGVWSQPGVVAPWDWRRWGSARHRQWFAENGDPDDNQIRGPPVDQNSLTAEVSGTSTSNEQVEPVALRHWLNTSSGVRHSEYCRWYKNTKRGRLCEGNEGRACGQCGG